MSDTSGLPNADDLGVPAEDDPDRFEGGAGAQSADRDAQSAEPDEDDPGQGGDVSGAHQTGVAPEGAEDVTTQDTQGPASHGSDGAEPPPADFDPTEQPSNPDLVQNTEPPDE
ncbi:hypothetical protein [Leifsonia shinshuensis]|uniref:Uncharacterized protein n=1 Tax=Leifsonia shinshuensis TaxID=150026 RepID=A0A7G6YCT9_9MICO|nr:hypothetical protein [Leifsonia shinshuensis]QNE36304.1 hypothetical protein F1C12_15085 [Leifsonia shinshuensis]